MKSTGKLLAAALILGAAALAAPAVSAQSFASTAAGIAVDDRGAPVAGVEIVITHAASGSTTRAMTNARGRWRQIGLRVGGGFSYCAIKAGYHPVCVDGGRQWLLRTTAFQPVMVPLAQGCAGTGWTRAAWRYTTPRDIPSCGMRH